jgi:S-adenosylhomocysteine hydrolase
MAMTGDEDILKFVEASRYGNHLVIRAMISSGIDVNAWRGEALREAVINDHEHIARIIVDAGGEVSNISEEVIAECASRQNKDMYKYLISEGAPSLYFNNLEDDCDESYIACAKLRF